MSLCPTYKHHDQEGGGFKPSGDVFPGRLRMKCHPGGDQNPGLGVVPIYVASKSFKVHSSSLQKTLFLPLLPNLLLLQTLGT